MSLDQRARAAGTALLDRVDEIAVPDVAPMVRRANRRRHLTTFTAALVVLAAVGAGLAIAAHEPAARPPTGPPPSAGGWAQLDKADAGLGETAVLATVDSNDGTVVVGGSLEDEARLWWSADGLTWDEAEHPGTTGDVFAVGLDHDAGLAVGSTGGNGRSDFVWRTEDGGRTWSEVASGQSMFGEPAPEMGRPFVSQLVRYEDHWVAVGGSSTGYAGMWASTDGTTWDQVLESRDSGSVSLTTDERGRLVAYGLTTFWATDEPTQWGPGTTMELPGDFQPSVIVPGGRLAVGRVELDGEQAVLSAVDPFARWEVDESSRAPLEDAWVLAASNAGGVDLVAGADAQQRPTAWVRSGDGWSPMPAALRGEPGGTLQLTAEVDSRIVVLGTAPELDRYYVYEP